MTLPYNRSFNAGRQGEQFLNEEAHRIFTALKNINYKKEDASGVEPESVLDGALWFDKAENQLKYYDITTRSWKCVFSQLFQITNNITSQTTPADPVLGQLWIYNGVLMYFDGSEWQPIRALEQADTQWSNAAFENFQIVSPLNVDYSFSSNDDTEHNTNYRYDAETTWSTDSGLEYKDQYPTYKEADPDRINRYLIPSVKNDRLFIDNKFDGTYTRVNDITLEYPETATAGKVLSCIHMNPGKLSNIKKRIFKVDKLNPEISINAYNTEFYGFRRDRVGGEFLIKSKNIDFGDYVVAGDKIVLNRTAAQNYDYVVAITYKFAWAKSNGSLSKHGKADTASSYYIVNMKPEAIAVHADGVMMEEANYTVDADKGLVLFEENVDNSDIDMWSPMAKQYGYIAETLLDGTGVIHLHEPVAKPLVFVGGILMDPTEIERYNTQEDKRTIYVPNAVSEIDNLIGIPWCVVDLFDINAENHNSGDVSSVSDFSLNPKSLQEIDNWTTLLRDGEIEATDDYTDVSGNRVYNYTLKTGSFDSEEELFIPYDKTNVSEESRFLLFVNGIVVCSDAIVKKEDLSGEEDIFYVAIRDDANGVLTLNPDEVTLGDRYTLIIDGTGRIYNHLDMEPAYNVGLVSDGLVYADGLLLLENNNFTTYESEDREAAAGPVYGEYKFFVNSEDIEESGTSTQNGYWAYYDSYNFKWVVEDDELATGLDNIRQGYTQFARILKIHDDLGSIMYPKENREVDDVVIYAFRFANAISGTYSIGQAMWCGNEEVDDYEYPVFQLGTKFIHGCDVVNLFLNGVKLVPGTEYREVENSDKVIVFIEQYDQDKDVIQYLIEPIETGESKGFETIVMDRDYVLGPNVYSIDGKTDLSLYPGRLTVYINGLRLSNNEWQLIDNKKIMLKFEDYIARGSTSGWPYTIHMYPDNTEYKVANRYPDYIMVEIRKDYDRKEQSLMYDASTDNGSIDLEDRGLPLEILDTIDDVLFFVNGQFAGLSKMNDDYYIDKVRSRILFKNKEFLAMLKGSDQLSVLLTNKDQLVDWQRRTGKTEHKPNNKKKITILWR